MKLGVLLPSTDTAVQPEYDAVRPEGVTDHVRGFPIPNAPSRTSAEFSQQLENMRATMADAMDDALTMEPGHPVLATAAEPAGGAAVRRPGADRPHLGGRAPGRHHGGGWPRGGRHCASGTNLLMARVAAAAEFWLGEPVVALNTATCWHAPRQNGIDDKVRGFARLLAEFRVQGGGPPHGDADAPASPPAATSRPPRAKWWHGFGDIRGAPMHIFPFGPPLRGEAPPLFVRVQRLARPPTPWTWAIHEDDATEPCQRSSRFYRSAEEAWAVGRAVLDRLVRQADRAVPGLERESPPAPGPGSNRGAEGQKV